MKFSEALTAAYPYSWYKQDTRSWKGKFTTTDGHVVEVGVYKDQNRDRWDLVFARDGKESLTKQGDQFQVFATVIKMAAEFVKDVKPGEIYFTAEKPATFKNGEYEQKESRAKLYLRLADRLAKTIGYKLDAREFDDSASFHLLKPAQESFKLLRDLLPEF